MCLWREAGAHGRQRDPSCIQATEARPAAPRIFVQLLFFSFCVFFFPFCVFFFFSFCVFVSFCSFFFFCLFLFLDSSPSDFLEPKANNNFSFNMWLLAHK